MSFWDVLPDSERQAWTFEPFVRVGPLHFGMTADETSAALGGVGADVRRHDQLWDTACHTYSEVGLKLYYMPGEGLCGISVDALRGPQVTVDGAALVGRVPSELEQWLCERAENREPYTELFYLPAAEVGSMTLGVVLCVQRAGDRLLTRPVFLPTQAMKDVSHRLPREAWTIF